MTPDSVTRRRFLATTAAACAFGAAGALGQNEVVLFDGKSLEGWHEWPPKRPEGAVWRVEDGAITGTQGPDGRGSLLLTDGLYGDFELLVDLRPDWGIDSGLFVRSTDRGQAWQITVDYCQGGYVGQIYGQGLGGFNTRTLGIAGVLDDDGNVVRLTATRRGLPPGAKLAHAITPEQWVAAWKVGEWNTLKVRVVGQLPRITTWLNGVKAVDFDAGAYEHPRYDPKQVAGIVGPRGRIAFQIHGGKARWAEGARCRWRNVRLRPIEQPQ